MLIHYCWFGRKPLTPEAIHCINSWKKFFPECDIVEWNENNFDINSFAYTAEAYRLGMYAFVSDFVRFYVLEKYGGIYFDTDVEVIKDMHDIIQFGQYIGMESGAEDRLNVGLGMHLEKGSQLAKDVIAYYSSIHFSTWSGVVRENVVDVISKMFSAEEHYKNPQGIYKWRGIYVYPPDYFCPLDYYTREINITKNTRTIHLYSASWVNVREKGIFGKLEKRLSYILSRIFFSIGIKTPTFTDNK